MSRWLGRTYKRGFFFGVAVASLTPSLDDLREIPWVAIPMLVVIGVVTGVLLVGAEDESERLKSADSAGGES